MIKLKRAYEPASRGDGMRILVDRLWPRGVSKEKLELGAWRKDVAPSSRLRTWFGHKPERWVEFKKRYKAELKDAKPALAELRKLAKTKTITLVYVAKDVEHTHAFVLKEVLDRNR